MNKKSFERAIDKSDEVFKQLLNHCDQKNDWQDSQRKELIKKYCNDLEKFYRDLREKIQDSLSDRIITQYSTYEMKIEKGEISEVSTIALKYKNADDYFINKDEKSFGIFDGVGHGEEKGGHIASRIAQEYVQQKLDEFPANIPINEAKDKMAEILNKSHNKITHEKKYIEKLEKH